MKKYKVILTRTQILDTREIEAKSKEEAIKNTFYTFLKYDRDDADNINVEIIDE